MAVNSIQRTVKILLNGTAVGQTPILPDGTDINRVLERHFRWPDTIWFKQDHNRTGYFPFPFSYERPPLQFNRLYVPSGAQRFAIGHFLASKSQLTEIIAASVGYPASGTGSAGSFFGSGGASGPSPPIEVKLEMGDPTDLDHYLVGYLYMLPPAPLSLDLDWNAIAAAHTETMKSGENGETLFIITLVDQRFFWAMDVVSDPDSGGGSGSEIASGSGSTCSSIPDSFSEAYGHITDVGSTGSIGSYVLGTDVAGYSDLIRLPFYLSEYTDLRTMNQGRMIGAAVPSDIGQTYEAISAVTSFTRLALDQAAYAEDLMANSSVSQLELMRYVPTTFVAYFQHYLDGVPVPGSYHRVKVLYTDIASGIPAGNGYPGEGVFFSWMEATVTEAGGCPTNQAALITAAQELALQFYQGCLVGAFEVYGTICPFQSNGLLDYVLYDVNPGKGLCSTTIRRFPWEKVGDANPPVPTFGSVTGGGGTCSCPTPPPTGECTGCGWLLDWPAVTTESSCLRLTIISTNGKCDCLDAAQTFDLYYDGVGGRWLGGTFATCCGCSVAEFTIADDADRPEAFGKLRLVKRNKECDTSDQTEYKLKNPRCCAPGTIDFDGANTRDEIDNCDGTVDPCSNYFTAKIECIDCPTGLCCCRGCYVGPDPACLDVVEAPPAFYLDLSSAGFTGAGIVWNIAWVLVTESTGNESCTWEAECLDPVVNITLAWIDDTGWRLTLSTTGGTAIYETSDPEGEDCCADIVLDKISSSFGGPATVSLRPIGCPEAGSCSDAPDGRTFSVILDANEFCTCLDGVTATLTYSGGVFTGTSGGDPCACTDHGSPVGNLVMEMPTDCSGFDIFCGECALGLLFIEVVERCPLTLTFGLNFTQHVGNCCEAGGPGTLKVVTATVVEN